MIFLAAASLMLLGCGSKTTEQPDAVSTPDSLLNEEAVVHQVEKVYQYLNDIRQYYLTTPVEELDDRKWERADVYFSTREWQLLRRVVDSIDREGECGGFYNFGDNGPLDPWLYDCFEGEVTVENIRVLLQDDGTAQADLTIRDATTIGNIPLHWLLRIEDGEWKVANIFFVKDDNYDLLQNMKDYVDAMKTPR